MAKPLHDFHLFKPGNYGTRGNWTAEKISQVKKNFRKRKYEDQSFDGIDVFVSLNQSDPHDKSQAVKLGMISDLYIKKDGTLTGNGIYYDEESKASVMRNLSGKSAGFVNVDSDDCSIDHVCVTSRDKAVIENLKPNAESMFSFQDAKEVVYIDMNMEFAEKEQNKMAEITFSKEKHELELKIALDKQKEELTANFAKGKSEIEKKLSDKETVIQELTEANEALKTKNAEFAMSEQNRTVKKWQDEIDTFKGIDVPKKTEIKAKVAEFAKKGMDYADIEVMIDGYREKAPLVQEGEEPGDPKPANFAQNNETVHIPDYWEAEKIRAAQMAGGK